MRDTVHCQHSWVVQGGALVLQGEGVGGTLAGASVAG